MTSGSGPRDGRVLLRVAQRSLALAGVALAMQALLVATARAHGDNNYRVGSTANGAGALTAVRTTGEPIPVSFSAAIAGFSIYTGDLPAFDAQASDEPGVPLFALDDGTEVRMQLAARSAGASVKINGVALSAVGASAALGTFGAANPSAFHADAIWTVTVPTGTTGDFQLSFKLTTTNGAYAESGVVTVVLRIPAATPTPTRTATPTATATDTPLASVTPTGSTPTTAATAVVPPHLADPAAARDADKCQKVLAKEAASIARGRLASLGGCATSIDRCVQVKADDDACLAKAAAACGRSMGKADAADASFATRLAPACAALAAGDLLGAAGLGFEAQVELCADLGIGVVDLATVAACVASRERCTVERLAVARHPRLVELLGRAGVRRDPSACLEGFGGDGFGAGESKGVGKLLVKCASVLRKAAAKLFDARTRVRAKCAGATFGCVQTKPGDAACLAKAAALCDKEHAKLKPADAKLGIAIEKGCGAIPFSILAGATGAGLEALAARCAVLEVGALDSLGDYGTCLLRSLVCAGEAQVETGIPRAGELLGLVGRSRTSAFCNP